jgi:SAM-dependent methyltransferase
MFDTYAEIFARRAAEYQHAMATWPRARDAEFECVLEPLGDAPQGLICDMPSGGGYLAAYLPPGMRYLGIDPAPDFFVGWPQHLERLNAEITKVPLPDECADFIVSLAGLHHEPSLPAVFAEMHRLLRRGGRAVIADVAIDTAPARFLNGFVNDHNPMGHDGRFLDDHTRVFIEAGGFDVIDDQIIDVPWTFDNFDDAGEFCRNLFGMTGLDARAVAEGMDREIGFDEEGGRPRVKWSLRRIVCDVD